MNPQSSNHTNAGDHCTGAALSGLAADAASQAEQHRWERDIFFQPRLLDAERRKHSEGRKLGLLLAMFVGMASCGVAFAQDGGAAQSRQSDQTSETTLSEWLWNVFTDTSNEETTTDSLKSGEDLDPEEGDPK